MSNLILNTDSYKYSMPPQYPAGTEYTYFYIASRGGKWSQTVFFGLQIFLKEILSRPITTADIDEAEELLKLHGVPFFREKWDYIVSEHGGKLPVLIKAVPEGTVVPVGHPLVTVTNTDPNCYWLPTFLETALLRAVWYPTTVATNSLESKRIIQNWMLLTAGHTEGIDFKLHDFGARGVSSYESACIGGLAHLVNFKGTDTVSSLLFARRYYGEKIAGFSIPASEHSVACSHAAIPVINIAKDCSLAEG